MHCRALRRVVGRSSFTIYEAKAIVAEHLSPVDGAMDGAMDGGTANGRGRAREQGGGAGSTGGGAEQQQQYGDDDVPVPAGLQHPGAATAERCGDPYSRGGECSFESSDADEDDDDDEEEDGEEEEESPRHRRRKEPRKEAHRDVELRKSFLCPITHELMEHPVVAPDGHTYERDAIEKWISIKGARHAKSPMTAAPMPVGTLLPNHTLKSMIAEYVARDR